MGGRRGPDARAAQPLARKARQRRRACRCADMRRRACRVSAPARDGLFQPASLDGEGAPEAPFGGFKVAASGVDRSETAERHADFVVLRRRVGARTPRARARAAARPPRGGRWRRGSSPAQRDPSRRGVIIAQRSGPDGDGCAGRGLPFGGPAASVREPADVVQDHADIGVRRTEPGDEDGVGVGVQRGRLVERRVYLSTTPRSLRTCAVRRSSPGRCRSATTSARRYASSAPVRSPTRRRSTPSRPAV